VIVERQPLIGRPATSGAGAGAVTGATGATGGSGRFATGAGPEQSTNSPRTHR